MEVALVDDFAWDALDLLGLAGAEVLALFGVEGRDGVEAMGEGFVVFMKVSF